MIDFEHFKTQYFKSRKARKPLPLIVKNHANLIRVYWLKAKIFVAEHSHFPPTQLDTLEIIDFMLLMKQCEEIAERKRAAWEKK